MKPISRFRDQYFFLSNFCPCKVHLEHQEFPSVEHAFQAAKTTDRHKRDVIARLLSAAEAKQAGQTFKLRSGWDHMRLVVMEDLLWQKFSKSPFHDQLAKTYPAELVEGNTWGDKYWGQVWDPRAGKWKGKNHLGRLLMLVRDDILDDRL